MGVCSILFLSIFLVGRSDAYSVGTQRQQRLILRTESKSPVIPDSTPLSSVLQQIVDERKEYQIHLGRAMDTLRKDMQNILTETPGMYSLDNLSSGKAFVSRNQSLGETQIFQFTTTTWRL